MIGRSAHRIALALALVAWIGLAAAQSSHAPASEQDYAWPNMTDFLKRLIDKLGPPIRVFKIEMNSDSKVDLWLQNNGRPDLIDSYEYDHGNMTGPIPVKFDHYPSVGALDHHVIELTTIDFQRLPAMLARARKDLKMPDADVSLIKLERGDSSGVLSFTDTPIWTFHLTNPRHDASVEFDLAGKVLSKDKD